MKHTVRIVSSARPDLGYMIINQEDFDPKQHQLWEEKSSQSVPEPAVEPAPKQTRRKDPKSEFVPQEEEE